MGNNDSPTIAMKEFELAWEEYFKNKPRPKSDKEEKEQLEEFNSWYNNVRKQSDTGKTPAEMYKEVYSKEPIQNSQLNSEEPSRMMNFEWDEDYDEELIGLVYELQEYDNKEGYKLEYNIIKEKLEPTISKIIKKGEKALDWLHELLEDEETWSCLFALEILGEIKSEKSIPHLIKFVEKNEFGDYFESCDGAVRALVSIGDKSSESLIKSIKNGIENKVFHGYLDEALSEINSKIGNEFRNSILKDYIKNREYFNGWFDLEPFICGFNEKNQESLPLLKELGELKLNKRERRELDDAIEAVEDPIGYKEKKDGDYEKFKILLEGVFNKISGNAPCPCGSGKEYKKCCLGKDEKNGEMQNLP